MINFLKNSKEYIFFFLITLLFAYIVGLVIIAVINQRLTDISINIPTPTVNVRWPTTGPQPSSENLLNNFQPQSEKIEEGYVNLRPSPNLNYNNDDLRGFVARKEYSDCTEATSQIQQEYKEQMNRVCIFRHDHKKYLCQYGQTNYLNPQELDPINRRLYQYNYFPNMTLQDYINWLWLYREESGKLCYEHYRNLAKLNKGQALKFQKGVCPPNLNADGHPVVSSTNDSSQALGKYYQEVMKYVDIKGMTGENKDGVKGYNFSGGLV